jgi:REP element-mobilizing transposase RayT
MIPHNRALMDAKERAMRDRPYILDARRRKAVAESIQETCDVRDWKLIALHARSNHVHVIVQGPTAPERMLNDFKSYASRRLSSQLGEERNLRRWTRHGSTRYLWDSDSVQSAVQYVLEEQGRTMQTADRSGEADL